MGPCGRACIAEARLLRRAGRLGETPDYMGRLGPLLSGREARIEPAIAHRALRSHRLGDATRRKGITKRYDEAIEVAAADIEWGPAAFVWRGRRYEVDRPLATWKEAPHVTNGHKYPDQNFFRLLARPEGSLATGDLDADGYMQRGAAGAVYDVYLDPARGEWRLARIWD